MQMTIFFLFKPRPKWYSTHPSGVVPPRLTPDDDRGDKIYLFSHKWEHLHDLIANGWREISAQKR